MLWLNEHKAEFVRLHETGISFTRIAAALNSEFGTAYSRNACIGQAHRLGLQRPENRYCGLSAEERAQRAKAGHKRQALRRKAKRWAAKPWLAEIDRNRKEREERSAQVRATCNSKTSPTYRNHLPRIPDMSKGELRAMLRQAVENTV